MTGTRTHYDPRTIPVPSPGHGPTDDGGRSWAPVPARLADLSVAQLRHPTEPSRFAVALVALSLPVSVAVFVMVSLGQATQLIAIMVGIALAVLAIWVGVQLYRIRLLGDAVLVSDRTLPQVQEVVDLVRSRLGYTRRVDLFVVDKISRVLSADAAPITMTTYFGVHVLVAEGEALGDLTDDRERRQLLFTLATYVGALKTRYAQWWSPLFTAFHMTGLAAFVWPFTYPYYRATVYSGDRIAYTCCGDLGVSLQSVYRSLVGKDVAVHLRAEGLTGQALEVRRRKLLRFAQLLRPTPHATNRYLHLLAFVRRSTPEAFGVLGPTLGSAGHEAAPFLVRIGRKRGHPGVVGIGAVLSILLLVAGLVVGLQARNSVVARAIADVFGSATNSGQDTGSGGGGSVATSEPSPPAAEEQLLQLVPQDLRDSCTPDRPDVATGLVALLRCSPGGDQPQEVLLGAYRTADGMHAAFESLIGNVPAGECSTGSARGTWTYRGVEQGPLGCYVSGSGQSSILWGSDRKAVLVLAQDFRWSPSILYNWWLVDAPYLT